MAQLAYKTKSKAASEREDGVAMTTHKAIEAGNSTAGPAHLGRSSAFSAGFFAGTVLVCDIFAILLSGLLMHGVYSGDFTRDLGRHFAAVGVFAVLTVLMLNTTGLYHFTAIVEPKRQVLRIGAALVGIFGLLGAMALTFEVTSRPSLGWALTWLGITFVAVVLFRTLVSLFVRSAARKGRLGRRILIYGATDQARNLIERIEKLGEPWNHIVGIFDDRVSRVGPRMGNYPVMGSLEDLIAWGRNNTLDEVLVALPWSAEARLLEVTRSLAVLPANVRLCPEILHNEMLHGRASHHFGLPMWNAFEKPLTGWGAIGKRLFDVVCAIVVLLLGLPVFILLALLIKLESRGPVLFRQKRYGFNNEVIEVYKFRSMRQEQSDPEARRLTERNDPRVTRLGRFMRRTSLDELPQLINVLRGEMSIVGPRPHAPKTTAGGRLCEEVVDRYSRRHRVKPGMTGWAQVNGYRGTMQDENHLQKRIEHDLYYINNWSPWFDLKILAMTLLIVIGGRNSY
jgi:Undecaprenyl-phosphate glucose phosphotransferase